MRKTLLILLLVAVAPARAEEAPPHWKHFGFRQREVDAAPIMKVPDVSLTASEWETLRKGEPVARLIETPEGTQIGTLRFFAPFDPVTAWMVVTDYEHYDLVDPLFAPSGSFTESRRTFLPNAFENNVCLQDGRALVSQLMVVPWIRPRRLCLSWAFRNDAFPWEAHLDLAGEARCCRERSAPDLEKYFRKAVAVRRNRESWFIAPLPEGVRESEADTRRADCMYVADVHPGGEIGRFDAITRRAAVAALPQLARHVVTQGNRWERFLTERYGEAELTAYRRWRALYHQAREHPQ